MLVRFYFWLLPKQQQWYEQLFNFKLIQKLLSSLSVSKFILFFLDFASTRKERSETIDAKVSIKIRLDDKLLCHVQPIDVKVQK